MATYVAVVMNAVSRYGNVAICAMRRGHLQYQFITNCRSSYSILKTVQHIRKKSIIKLQSKHYLVWNDVLSIKINLVEFMYSIKGLIKRH